MTTRARAANLPGTIPRAPTLLTLLAAARTYDRWKRRVRAGDGGSDADFKPFMPYQERSSGLRYGEVAGGAALAGLWPNQPALEYVSTTRLREKGARATKAFGFQAREPGAKPQTRAPA